MSEPTGVRRLSTNAKEQQHWREAYRDLEAVLQSTADEIFITDGEGRTLRVSAGCERHYGIQADRLIGRSVFELERKGIFAPSATSAALREGRRVTILQTTCSGHRLMVTATPYQDEEGNVCRVVCNSRDLTDLFELRNQLRNAEQLVRQYQTELATLRVGESESESDSLLTPGLEPVMRLARKAAGFDSTVLIQGESGAGKDVLAHYIHSCSVRREGPFIRVNCGAIPEQLLESELFGYDPGAFTGARKEGRAGQFELANGGTLFLNEVSELPLQLQVKLLQAVQDRQFNRVGGSKPIKISVRFIAASNRNLKQMVAEGEFRADLYYRLHVIPISVPPLRSRPEDVLPLARYFLDRWNRSLGEGWEFGQGAVPMLQSYAWPGNVRELENTVERLVVTSEGPVIQAEEVRAVLENLEAPAPTDGSASASAGKSTAGALRNARDEAEARLVRDAYERTGGNSYRVAHLLGVSQASAFRKIQKYIKNTDAH